MFSRELQELDRNTVQYMIDVMQDTINEQCSALQQKDADIRSKETALQQKDNEIALLKKQLAKIQK